MTQTEALVILNMIGDIGSSRLLALLNYFGKPENILKASSAELSFVLGPGSKITERIRNFKTHELQNELCLARKYNLGIITIQDKNYPENLKNIPGPPIVIYVKGSLQKDDKYSIAIVGSRRASFYGLRSAEKFAFELSQRGFTIVSGMARGIDTYAHRGALKQGGRTLAVLGSGFTHIYPPENKGLAEEIAKNGAVISEFPINTMPLKQNFPRRNRIISGLSLGVLVVEAAKNSGALITADFALEQGREVFALPGEFDSGTSFGTNELIKQGAKLICGIEDITEEIIMPVLECVCIQKNAPLALELPVADKKEHDIYNLISDQSIQFDELAEKTRLDILEISDILLRLQMKGKIKQLAGKQFIRS